MEGQKPDLLLGGQGKVWRGSKWEKLERKTNHERLLTLGNDQRVAEGKVGWGIG